MTIILTSLKTLWRKNTPIKRWLPLDDSQWAKLNLLKILVQRDLEGRYKGSVLGKFWPLINQVSQLLIYTYVFGIVLKVKLSLAGLPQDSSLVFGLWLFAGLVPWLAFSGGLSQSTLSVIQQPNLVKKVVFPLTL
ncbi:MAG: ABC transporter permease, partial [Nodosilinea sp.]